MLGVTVLYPFLKLLFTAVHGWRMDALLGVNGFAAIRNTVVISFASVVTSGLLGTALAFALTHYEFPGSRFLAGVAYLPFTLPPLVGVVSFYYLVGRDGFLPRLLERTVGIEGWFLEGPIGILVVHTYSFYVFFYAMVSTALTNLDTSQLEAARTLGARPSLVFRRVVLPMLMPALAGASLLTFMSSGASFSAPLIFGGDYTMLTVEIYNSQHQPDVAATLTVVLAIVSFVGILVFRSRTVSSGTASKGTRMPLRSRRTRWPAMCLAWFGTALLVSPHLTILWLSFIDHRAWHEEVFPSAFTVYNYVSIFTDSGALAPIRNSLWMSAVAAGLTLLVALPAAYLIARRRPGGRLLNLLVMLPWALPGTVIAMNLIAAFNTPWLAVGRTLWMLPLAYYVRSVPLLTRVTGAAIETFDTTLLEAGRSLGGSPWFCFRRIVVPLLTPAIAAGVALVFALSLGEFVASILLYSPSNIPVAVQVYMVWRGSGVGAAFAYSVFLMVIVTATFLASRRFSARVL